MTQRPYYLLIVLLFVFSNTQALKRKSSRTSTPTLAELVTTHAKKASTGIKIVNLENSRTLYERLPTTHFIPASNTKICTAGAALHILGPSFRYETLFSTDTSVGVSRIGNLFIKGSGDPTLLYNDLKAMVLKVRAQGIREIKGNIIIDSSIFDDQSAAPGWAPGDGPIFDKSELRGFLVDHSCLTVRIKPAHAVGRKPLVTIEPSTSFLKIDNRAITVSNPTKQAIHTFVTHDNKILITGKIALKSGQKFYRIALRNPDLFAGHVVQELLRKHGIIHRGTVRKGIVPAKVRIVARHYSKPVHTIINTMMKKSDNLYADALFKTVGARRYGAQGTWATGKKAVEDFLIKTMNLSERGFILNDGSGLSRTNRLSAAFLVDFLIAMYKKSPFKNHFINSLPIAGVDGSLRHRMGGSLTKGAVRAKTGSLAGVSSLSGYITLPSGEHLVFSLLTNKRKGQALSFKTTLEDRVCGVLLQRRGVKDYGQSVPNRASHIIRPIHRKL
ncbi:D-alanyl-D-alanine carboxypeptidase/D-alanyl-D-alanine-endopeptidase [Candidatus Dependentiae bacterium]|nr:D-alanyl-D-alanine carboxypeptidase/D-alanyl-D-alanine-endopeptidase [Candidatus Dependentiae bacterium]